MTSITYSERIKLETLLHLGWTQVNIAQKLQRAPSTISYELTRCSPYTADAAQTNADLCRRRCGRKTILTGVLKTLILNHLRLAWSPETIAHYVSTSTKSIYNWLNQELLEFPLEDLLEHGLRHKRRLDLRSRYNQFLGRSIEQRPEAVTKRVRLGDFEVDTIVGPRGQGKACLLTLIDRKTRFFWAYWLPNRTKTSVNVALERFLTTFKGRVHSITVDHGLEFTDLPKLEATYTGLKIYYCHAYTPSERGSNERFNRTLRYFYPKGSSLEHISVPELTSTLLQINQKPLKILKWESPFQRLLAELTENSD